MAGWSRDCSACLSLKQGAVLLVGAYCTFFTSENYGWRLANGLPIDLFVNSSVGDNA